MLPSVLIIGAVFLGVVALIVGIAVFFRDQSVSQMEDRLSSITGKGDKNDPAGLTELTQLLSRERGKNAFETAFGNLFNLNLLFEQAEVTMSTAAFLSICLGLGVGSASMVGLAGLNVMLAPVVGIFFASLPFFWLVFRRKRRFAKFAAQLPEALELVARALRAGHSLAAGFHLVSQEGSDPIASEFGRVFEEQNLGLPFEEALSNLCDRIPNLDLKFFVTAVILQRQTGGDLAEILDKIGRLIRERYAIWGQVQALTGEGRLSGIVLLALPPLLFITVYRMNPDYLSLLFTDELGKKMLVGGIVMQLLGALAIRKIVNIRV
ncbi:type II secretion system F family protein [Bythopirellula goksoeyrii]|uniref:Bacterial type II secretion system protein F domain protein n=1 Tax=Bythopirellula goksoeyrii TaxID=1400387 RepID=A0A5B9QCF0_9BACT|nr:type II secretion system F family protein [Bythopirellula goksoeyrii]QEG34606.1 Bacterial type II secretion system protein F domain protein [Bythopirellula goksoeyrii]